ncbi:MAG TPA: hypothetical protein VJ785_05155 [Anaerolineales bacterium]|nr:hypothetical protein [Anaerolineales bacterium]
MSDEKKEKQLHPETNFLPPLKMFLAFFDRDTRKNKKKNDAAKQETSDEKNVEKLIEKLSEKEEKFEDDSDQSTH